MEPATNASSEEELFQLRNEGKISETEYNDLRAAMAKSARGLEEPARPSASDEAFKHKRGKTALVVMLVGLSLPALGFGILAMSAGPNQAVAIGPWFFLGVAFEIVAFALGVSSWPDIHAKITVIILSAFATFGVVLFSLVWLWTIESERSRKDMTMAEVQHTRKEQRLREEQAWQGIAMTELKLFALDNMQGLITQSGIRIDQETSYDGNGSLRIDATEPTTIRLFETGDIDIENARLIYQANVRAENIDGQAYLEMLCHFPGKGDFFSRGLMNPLTGTTDWTTLETPFFLKMGEKPDNIKLNLVVKGKGTVWIDDIRLLKGPLI